MEVGNKVQFGRKTGVVTKVYDAPAGRYMEVDFQDNFITVLGVNDDRVKVKA